MAVPSKEHETGTPDEAGEDVAGSSSVSSAEVGGTVEEYIGSRLRQAFDSVAQQPVPDRFLQLIASLDKS